ncbi:uncharacterized protein PGRI_031550 [Penicillium griseofulvum]|uniref:Fucose-specific lectin n=1 Tax=Penicillium patulum TaxID=5078 RepID=A0A135LJY3_PENPA|nr:uncharacterized protein PGRI_031550 [Penicillium griseofulvum]KXG49285.1 hypothetical protein PGRI_031550 [Penicillium griseofulvum]
MAALTSSDYAAVSDGTKIYLYYQNGASQILEVTSSDGSSWTESPNPVADKLNPAGSPITAYYVANDGAEGNKPSIHLFFIDASGILHEKVKSLPHGTSWKDKEFASQIEKSPATTSRLSSGICHDGPKPAHQWLFFEEFNTATGVTEISELRCGDDSGFQWRYRKGLSEGAATALPGTQLATNLTDTTTHLFFQRHDGEIFEYLGSYDKWHSQKPILKSGEVEISTPLAAISSKATDKPYLFYVTKTSPYEVMAYTDGTKTKVGLYVPGTKLGAVSFGGKIYLFQKPLDHPASVWTRVYDGNSWKLGSKVVE